MRTKHEIIRRVLENDDQGIPSLFELSVIELLADIRDALIKNNKQ